MISVCRSTHTYTHVYIYIYIYVDIYLSIDSFTFWTTQHWIASDCICHTFTQCSRSHSRSGLFKAWWGDNKGSVDRQTWRIFMGWLIHADFLQQKAMTMGLYGNVNCRYLYLFSGLNRDFASLIWEGQHGFRFGQNFVCIINCQDDEDVVIIYRFMFHTGMFASLRCSPLRSWMQYVFPKCKTTYISLFDLTGFFHVVNVCLP